MKTIQNLLLFKLGWVACILFAAAGQPLLSILSVSAVAGLHLARVAVPAKEAFFLLCALAIGLFWESVVFNTGLLQYVGVTGDEWIAPAWIIAMWLLFATTINHGLSWLKRHWILPVVFGLIGGPMAFYAGSKMGAVQFTDIFAAMALLGAGWAVLLPLTCLLSDVITDSQIFEPEIRPSNRVARLEPVDDPQIPEIPGKQHAQFAVASAEIDDHVRLRKPRYVHRIAHVTHRSAIEHG